MAAVEKLHIVLTGFTDGIIFNITISKISGYKIVIRPLVECTVHLYNSMKTSILVRKGQGNVFLVGKCMEIRILARKNA